MIKKSILNAGIVSIIIDILIIMFNVIMFKAKGYLPFQYDTSFDEYGFIYENFLVRIHEEYPPTLTNETTIAIYRFDYNIPSLLIVCATVFIVMFAINMVFCKIEQDHFSK